MTNKLLPEQYLVYTDGSACNKCRMGGWGYVILDGRQQLIGHGYNAEAIPDVTSNVMELTAAIQACQHLQRMTAQHIATIHCDSQYVVKGVTEWREGWLRRGWRNYEGQLVSNRLYWKRLYAHADGYERTSGRPIQWRWVRGHNGNYWNEVVDRLALYQSTAADKQNIIRGVVDDRCRT